MTDAFAVQGAFVPKQEADEAKVLIRSSAVQFEPIKTTLSARSGSVALRLSDDVVMFYGGLGEFEDALRGDVVLYHLNEERWESVACSVGLGSTRPRPSFGASAVLLSDGEVLLFSGQVLLDAPVQEAHHFCPKTRTWHSATFKQVQAKRSGPPIDLFRWGTTLVPVPQWLWPRVLTQRVAETARDVLLVVLGDGREPCDDILVLWRENEEFKRRAWKYKRYVAGGGTNGPQGRRRHGVVLYRDAFLFVFGGRSGRTFMQDLWMFSIAGGLWMEIRPGLDSKILRLIFESVSIPRASSYFREACTLHRALIKMERSRLVRPESTHQWPAGRTGVSCALHGDGMLIMAGFCISRHTSLTYNDAWYFDFRTAKWIMMRPSLNFSEANREKMESRHEVSLGPTPHSMAAFVALPRKPGDHQSYLLHGGRLQDVAIEPAFKVHVCNTSRPRLVEDVMWRLALFEALPLVADAHSQIQQRQSETSGASTSPHSQRVTVELGASRTKMIVNRAIAKCRDAMAVMSRSLLDLPDIHSQHRSGG